MDPYIGLEAGTALGNFSLKEEPQSPEDINVNVDDDSSSISSAGSSSNSSAAEISGHLSAPIRPPDSKRKRKMEPPGQHAVLGSLLPNQPTNAAPFGYVIKQEGGDRNAFGPHLKVRN